MNKELPKLMQLLTDIDNMEDFLKISAVDGKIDKDCAREILRLIQEMKDRALN